MKIVTVVGARPQFIKTVPLSRALRYFSGVSEILVHTGQHFDKNMSDVFFNELEIQQPKYNLGISGSSHGAMTGQQLAAIEQVLVDERPDMVLVYGDTNSTLAGALAAVKLHIPVAHVEAGLRSFNRKMPEEINRTLTDHAADLLFAPTETAVKNLTNEGLREKAYLVGDIMYDAALYYAEKAEQKSDILRSLNVQPKGYILTTVHRAENTDDPVRLRNIVAMLSRLAKQRTVVFPLHPRTRNALVQSGLQDSLTGCMMIDPVGYLDMVMLEKNAQYIVTDSGGVQKEAYFHKVPCITLRDETEWVELVELGWNRLGSPREQINLADILIRDSFAMREGKNSYGDGRAARHIAKLMLSAK
ncbi:MAG: UDP-N-acetylglucosamine 2-epimerase (non-hydrolyzing) [Candidatus Electrothrix sp. AUS1_2]|nr:UDP-N-acetylglucosamine 2-epimerase (non-hydrolyzing) [Candidatus Electrothrix sp. AUS1_2]